MALNIIISGSRASYEKQLLKRVFEENGLTGLSLYDCDEHATNITREGKQTEINNLIERCDWYILLAPTKRYGEFTYVEWQTILNAARTRTRDQIITVFRCLNCEESFAAQNPDTEESGPYTFEDFDRLRIEAGLGEQFYLTYTFNTHAKGDARFAELQNVINNEIRKVMKENLAIRKHSIGLDSLQACDIFANRYRTEAQNGFDEDMYISRTAVDGKLETLQDAIFVVGPPASGKTRAVYEHLKSLRELPDTRHDRIIVVKDIEELVADLEAYTKWHRSLNDRDRQTEDLSHYHFVCDQIIDLARSDSKIELLTRFLDTAISKYNARLLATALKDDYEYLVKRLNTGDIINLIEIPKLSSSSDWNFRKEFKRMFGVDITADPSKQVIGEYIKGLVDYNRSILNLIKSYNNRLQDRIDIECFIYSYSIIRLFRRGNIVPLGLVLVIYEQIKNIQLTSQQVSDFNTFCQTNNLLTFTHEAGIKSLQLKRDTHFEYDSEMLLMSVDPKWTVSICNDFIWEVLYAKYSVNINDPAALMKSMQHFYNGFYADNPIVTLRRIIARSPAVNNAIMHHSHSNFVWEEVKNFMVQLSAERPELWDEQTGDMAQLAAYILHRSDNMEVFMSTYEEMEQISAGKFRLDEELVAELMGFCDRRNRSELSKFNDFLASKSWDQANHKGISYYYHSRMVRYIDRFKDIVTYMRENVLIPEVANGQTCDDNLCKQNRLNLVRSILPKCRKVGHIIQLLDWYDLLDCNLDKKDLNDLCGLSQADKFKQSRTDNARWVAKVEELAIVQGKREISEDLACYYLARMTNCFINAQHIYTKYEALLNKNPGLKPRFISVMVRAAKEDEFGFICRFFFDNRKLRPGIILPQVSRNVLLKRLNTDDAITMAELLFDGTTPDSTPDVNTLISLLTDNLEYLKRARFKGKAANKDMKVFTFQNLLHILSLPLLRDIIYNESAVSLIFQCCLNDKQEQHIIDNYITPNMRTYLSLTEKSASKAEAKLKKYVEDELEYAPNFLVARMTAHEDYEWIMDHTTQAVERMLESYHILDSSLLSNTMRKFFIIFRNAIDANPKNSDEAFNTFDEHRQELLEFMHMEYADQHSAEHKEIMGYFIKDDSFYRMFYRLYPEKAVTLNHATNQYELSAELMNIPVKYIDNKLFSVVLQGITHTMDLKVLRDIEAYMVRHTNFYWDARTFRIVTDKYPDYKAQTEEVPTYDKDANLYLNNQPPATITQEEPGVWDRLNQYFLDWKEDIDWLRKERKNADPIAIPVRLLDDITAHKEAHPDSLPSMALMHPLLKSGAIHSYEVLDLLEDIYLKPGLSITSSLWNSALEGFKKRRNKKDQPGIGARILELKDYYEGLIFENTTSLVYQIDLLKGKEQGQYFHRLTHSDGFKSLIDYSGIIRLYFLFNESDINDYVSYMTSYDWLNRIVYGEQHISDTYPHFLINCLKIDSGQFKYISKAGKVSIMKILTRMADHINDKQKDFIKKDINRTKYASLLQCLATECGQPTDKLQEFWNKGKSEM